MVCMSKTNIKNHFKNLIDSIGEEERKVFLSLNEIGILPDIFPTLRFICTIKLFTAVIDRLA